MFARLVALVALTQTCLAFSDTAPVVSWASKRSSALDLLPASFAEAGDIHSVISHIVSDDSICNHHAIIVVDQPELHASDLRALSSTSSLSKSLEDAISSIQLPYVRRGALDVRSVTSSLAERCGAQSAAYTPGALPELAPSSKHVIALSMPELSATSGSRKSAVAQHESLLSAELSALGRLFPDHFVILTSSSPLVARDAPSALYDSHAPAPIAVRQNIAPTPSGNYTVPGGGILARYQLLTPALITSLLVTFFVLIPVVIAGVSALSSIQSPLRMEAPKGFSATERKNQ